MGKFLMVLVLLAGFLSWQDSGRDVTLPRQDTDVVSPVPTSGEVLGDTEQLRGEEYTVVGVIDGDTIDVEIEGEKERVRLIGVNTPESVDPRRPVQCFGKEAKDFLKSLVLGKMVTLEADSSQSNRDQYDRLLRFVFVEDLNVNLKLLEEGFAFEYTFDEPYIYQKEFRAAENLAEEKQLGLWSAGTCSGDVNYGVPSPTLAPMPTGSCVIKGNISGDGRKLYHMPGCRYYVRTGISVDNGERWFCSEDEAVVAGWIRAGNCS